MKIDDVLLTFVSFPREDSRSSTSSLCQEENAPNRAVHLARRAGWQLGLLWLVEAVTSGSVLGCFLRRLITTRTQAGRGTI